MISKTKLVNQVPDSVKPQFEWIRVWYILSEQAERKRSTKVDMLKPVENNIVLFKSKKKKLYLFFFVIFFYIKPIIAQEIFFKEITVWNV